MLSDANKTLLVLKSSSEGLGSSEVFLRNRGWKIRVTTDIKQALIYLIQEQPQFVMISIDHPHPKALKLPKIIKAAFPACVIVYAEKNSVASFNLLNQAGAEYTLYPPITGPSLERLAHKYFRDLESSPCGEDSDLKTYSQRRADGVIAIRGSGAVGRVGLQNFLAQMMRDEGNCVMPDVGESDANPAEQQGVRSKLFSRTPEEIHRDPRSVKRDSIILRGARVALESSCRTESNLDTFPIGHTEKLHCLVIELSRFSGFLVTAIAEDVFEEDFMQAIRARLTKFLSDNGEHLVMGTVLELKIRSVPFESWALECAEFLRKSVHKGRDVGMAFFPHSRLSTDFEESPTDKYMISLAIEELVCGSVVEFNLYLYLPRNEKFLLYTPEGGVFYESQKARLKTQGVSKLYVNKDDIAFVQRYRIQNFLNEKIQMFAEDSPLL